MLTTLRAALRQPITHSLVLAMLSLAGPLEAEDIDVFAGALTGSAAEAARPNIIFVLDNTSNWSSNSQDFPEEDIEFYVDGPSASPETSTATVIGEFELAAISSALRTVSTPGPGGQVPQFNVGILSFDSNPNPNDDGGTVRFDVRHYQGTEGDVTVQGSLDTILKTSFDNVRDPDEKLNSNSPFGTLAYDVYNYLTSGNQAWNGLYTVAAVADATAYDPAYSTFESPLTETAVCAETYLIWIGNPNQQGPRGDSSGNSDILRDLYTAAGGAPARLAGDASGTSIPMPEFEKPQGQGGGSSESKGYTEMCFDLPSSCSAAVDGAAGVLDSGLGQTIVDECSGASICSCTGNGKKKKPDGSNCEGQGNSQLRSYEVVGDVSGSSGYTKTGDSIDGTDYNLDDWARFFYDYGVPVPGTDTRSRITTFTVDVFDAKPSEEFSSLLESAANVGGGYRVEANNFAELEAALVQITSDILSVNSSFSAVTLPLSAAQQGRSLNQVFIASFTPTSGRLPRWLGNLKRYKLQLDSDGSVDLVDSQGTLAVNPLTGIVADCAVSAWTTSSGDYFQDLQVLDPEVGSCEVSEESFNSDLPDGPHVAKGGAAQQIRALADDQGDAERNLFVLGGSPSSVRFASSAGASVSDITIPGDDADLNVQGYVKGEVPGLKGGDQYGVNDAEGSLTSVTDPLDGTRTYFTAEAALNSVPMPDTGLRATIHGDVVHSQPLTVTYSTSSVKVFYGANDGFFRQVDAATGLEDWAFVATEHLGKLRRLYDNAPTIRYSNTSDAIDSDIEDATKGYFMDGVSGLYIEQNADLSVSKAWLYPTMRRGGNFIYGLDVSPSADGVPPTEPTFLWKHETSGQTWGRPWVGKVNGLEAPVLVTGGGYDSCLDPADDATDYTYDTLCPSPSGTEIVILNAFTGAVIQQFEPTGAGSFVADVSVEDVDGDGAADFAYAVDAKGSLYRISFGSYSGGVFVPATSASWRIDQVTEVSTGSDTKLRFFNKPIANPFLDNQGNRHLYVLLGAGDRERPMEVDYPYTDSDSGVPYYMYAVLDRTFAWDHDGDGAADDASPDARPAVVMPDSNDAIDCEPSSAIPCYGFLDISTALSAASEITPVGTRYDYHGWYFELPDRGEQIINPPVVELGKVFFNSYQPDGGGFCSVLGTAKGYNVSLFDPVEVNDSVFNVPALPPPPVIPAPVEVCDENDENCRIVTPCFYCGDVDNEEDNCAPTDTACGLLLEVPYEVEKSYRVLDGPDV